MRSVDITDQRRLNLLVLRKFIKWCGKLFVRGGSA